MLAGSASVTTTASSRPLVDWGGAAVGWGTAVAEGSPGAVVSAGAGVLVASCEAGVDVAAVPQAMIKTMTKTAVHISHLSVCFFVSSESVMANILCYILRTRCIRDRN